tara:strand:+ start:223 stop:582 length:360 start_codon:yes stop_codon:yes gene_type:complete
MKKLLTERFQELAGIRPLYQMEEGEGTYQGVGNKPMLNIFKRAIDNRADASFSNKLTDEKTPVIEKQKMIVDLIKNNIIGRSLEADRKQYTDDFYNADNAQRNTIQFTKALGDFLVDGN